MTRQDVAVPISDGIVLRANVYRPSRSPSPVVLSVTSYGKDNTPDRLGMLAMRLAGCGSGIRLSQNWGRHPPRQR